MDFEDGMVFIKLLLQGRKEAVQEQEEEKRKRKNSNKDKSDVR